MIKDETAMSAIKVHGRRAEQADVEGTVQGRGQHRELLLVARGGRRTGDGHTPQNVRFTGLLGLSG